MKSIRANNIQIAYQDEGGGPPLLLLHGFSLDHSMWAGQVEELQRSYRLIVPDIRGSGETENPSGAFSIETMADDAAALLEAINISAAAVAGFSMGGYILAQMLVRHPLKVRAAAFVSSGGTNADDPARQETRVKTMRFVIDEGAGAFADSFIPKLFSPTYLNSHPLEVDKTRSVIEGQLPGSIALLLGAMRERADVSHYAKNFAVPCAAIGGTEDVLVPLEVMEGLHESLADSTIELIHGAGHMTTVEAPEIVSDQLDRLMQRAGMWEV